jgi:hypothetical protein
MNARADHARLADLAEAQPGPTDIQIVDALVEAFDLTAQAAIERLKRFDFVTVRQEVAP